LVKNFSSESNIDRQVIGSVCSDGAPPCLESVQVLQKSSMKREVATFKGSPFYFYTETLSLQRLCQQSWSRLL